MHGLGKLACFCCLALVIGCGHGSQQEQPRTGDTTREAVAKATQRMKPEIKWTARKMGEAAKWATEETIAAMEGFIEGWFRPSAQPVNVNSASERQLETLPGVTATEAHRIIRARPYRDKRELLQKGIITESAYARISDRITAD